MVNVLFSNSYIEMLFLPVFYLNFVDNKWTYTWFMIDSKTRAICGYNLSQHRGMQPAMALLYNSFGKPDETVKHPDLVTDGNPSLLMKYYLLEPPDFLCIEAWRHCCT